MKYKMKILLKHIYIKLILAGIFFSLGFYHSIHISYGNANLNNRVFSGKIIFYKDDFFKALNNEININHKVLSNDEYNRLKLNYLQSHLTACVNNNLKLDLNLTGSNEDASSIWFDFQFESREPINYITIQYDALINEFSGQMNLLNIKTPAGEQSLIFSASQKDIKIQL